MEKRKRRRGSKLLSDRHLRATKPGAPPLYDGDGLRFMPSRTTAGRSSAQLRFLRPDDGKPDTFSLGAYPLLSLESLRDDADEARKLIARGKNPKKVKREQEAKARADAANKFKAMADAWRAAEAKREGWSARHAKKVEQMLCNHLAPLDELPIVEILAPVTAPIMRTIEDTAPGMKARIERLLNGVMDYAVEQGAIAQNPLPRRRQKRRGSKAKAPRHYPAVVDLPGLGTILRTAREDPAPSSAERAHLLLTYTAQRIAEVIGARWSEFDLEAGTWSIPRERMKRKDEDRGPHVVPIPPRLLAQLREWRKADGDKARYVCPAKNKRKPIIADLVGKYYRDVLDLQGKHSPHSWRSAFSTVCREAGKPGDVIEAQLDHQVGTNTASAYDRAERLAQRRKLLAWYESTLVAARDGATVVPLKARG